MSRRTNWVSPAIFALAAGCNLAPKYTRPSTPGATAYKELTPANYQGTTQWKVAEPQDDRIRGKWWEIFGDPLLNELEEQIDTSNQSLAQAWANYRAARALVAEARTQLFPTISTSPSYTRQKLATTSFAVSSIAPINQFQLPVSGSWEIDLWGRIRNTVEANANQAQSTAATLENTRLSLHGQLAVNYFELRSQDALKQLYDETVAAFQKDLDLVKIRHEGGIASEQDVSQAETQLKTAIASATALLVNRALFEHAIAVLGGKMASAFSLPVAPLPASTKPPLIPVGIPSQLLERRPDIAAAERLVAQANANIGVARAAYFPALTLTGDVGFSSRTLSRLISAPSIFWSWGASLSETLFDAGRRKAQLADAWAVYDGSVASYRSTVLTAFQQVEDQLATLRILEQQRQQQDDAVQAAQKALDVALDRYKYGVDSYLNVITAQTALLTNQQTATTIRMNQMNAGVQLVVALGGGWDVSQLPSDREVRSLLSEATNDAEKTTGSSKQPMEALAEETK